MANEHCENSIKTIMVQLQKQVAFKIIFKPVSWNEKLCFRPGVGKENRMRNGVPKLLGLAEELDVSFSFFINRGKGGQKKRVVG